MTSAQGWGGHPRKVNQIEQQYQLMYGNDNIADIIYIWVPPWVPLCSLPHHYHQHL